jgi:hypothetical protein
LLSLLSHTMHSRKLDTRSQLHPLLVVLVPLMRAAWPMVLLRKIVKNFYKMPKDLASSGNLKRRDKKRNKKKRKEKRTLHNHSLTPIHPKFFLFFFFFFFSLSLSLSLSPFSLFLSSPHTLPPLKVTLFKLLQHTLTLIVST